MKIEVAARHVQRSMERGEDYCVSGWCCPIFQAFSEAFNTNDVYAGIETVRIKATYYRLSDNLVKQVEHFCHSHEWTLFGEFEIEDA